LEPSESLSQWQYTLDELKHKFKLAKDIFDHQKLVPVQHLEYFADFLE